MEIDCFTDYRLKHIMSHAAGVTTQEINALDNTFGAMLIGTLFSMTYVKPLSFLHGAINTMCLVCGE